MRWGCDVGSDISGPGLVGAAKAHGRLTRCLQAAIVGLALWLLASGAVVR